MSWEDFILNVLHVVLVMLNIFAITFLSAIYIVTVFEILDIFPIGSYVKTMSADGGHLG